MAMRLNVKFDIRQARRELDLDRKEVNRGAARAIQRVAVTVRKVSDQKIRETIALPSSKVKAALSIAAPAGQRTLVRDVVATGDPIPIRDYGAKKTRRGVTFKVTRGGKRKVWQVQGRKGFIVDRFGGHVFTRVEDDPPGPKKGRMRKAYGPSLTHRFGTKKVQTAMDTTGRQRWPIEFDREMKFRLGKK